MPLRCNPTSSANAPRKVKSSKPEEIKLSSGSGLRTKEAIEATGAYERPKYRPNYTSKYECASRCMIFSLNWILACVVLYMFGCIHESVLGVLDNLILMHLLVHLQNARPLQNILLRLRRCSHSDYHCNCACL